jgi:hypothetical protein
VFLRLVKPSSKRQKRFSGREVKHKHHGSRVRVELAADIGKRRSAREVKIVDLHWRVFHLPCTWASEWYKHDMSTQVEGV